MRIAIDGRYIQDHFPGIAAYTFNLIRHLAAENADKLIVFHNPRLPNSRYDLNDLSRLDNVHLVPLAVPTFSLREQWRLPLAALHEGADILHSPYYIKPYLPSLPSVTTVCDVISAHYPTYLPSRHARWLFALTTRLALATSRRVITLSECSRRDLCERYGTALVKVAVTHLAADPRYRPLDRRQCEPLRQIRDLPPRFALYVGINKPHKNLVTLVEAVALARRNTDLRLVIAGAYDPRWPEAHHAVARLGLDRAVTFLKNVPTTELPLLYNLAEYFAFPSLYEGFGLPPLEAMACGRPVICSNSSSLPEVVADAAVTLDPRDRDGWADSLVELWDSPERREELARRSLARAALFSWQKTARRTLDVYAEALRS